jgi:hypothetical protein
LTAKDSSMGNSGGTTEVMIKTQSSKSFPFAIPRSSPDGLSVLPYACAMYTPTLDPDIGTSSDGEDEEETDEQEALKVVGRDTLGREDHGPDKLSLSGTETGTKDDSETSTVRGLSGQHCDSVSGGHTHW